MGTKKIRKRKQTSKNRGALLADQPPYLQLAVAAGSVAGLALGSRLHDIRKAIRFIRGAALLKNLPSTPRADRLNKRRRASLQEAADFLARLAALRA